MQKTIIQWTRAAMACLVVFSATCLFAAGPNVPSGTDALPASWRADWNAPQKEHRPLQILHGWLKGWATMHEPSTWDFSTFTHPGKDGPGPRSPESVARIFREIGFGGIVCNVGGEDYFRDEKQWKLFLDAFDNFDKAGLRIWIYDEQGYPSLGAGGLVLEKKPELESRALVYDAELDGKGADPFAVRPAFEYTHAANNVRVLRRYPDPLNPESTRLFLETTHAEYKRRLGPERFKRIEAFFTDEPSIIAFNLSSNPGRTLPSMQARVDTTVRNLPMLPWNATLPELYRERYGQNLVTRRRSLFTGDTREDREVRGRFWALVAELDRENYYSQIQDWLRREGSSVPTCDDMDRPLRLASSGHLLAEESIPTQIACDGNKIANMCRMDLPGLDLLSSDPESFNYLSAALPCSAAQLSGKRLVMTEVSDMAQWRLGAKSKKPASLDMMKAIAVAQAAWGVTEFTSYYRFEIQGKEVFRQYGDYIGRLNAILRKARPARPVLLFYPVEELQGEFRPNIKLSAQSGAFTLMANSLVQTGRTLNRLQIPFVLIDRTRFDAAASGRDAKTVELAGSVYDTLVVPKGSKFTTDRVQVVRADAPDPDRRIAALQNRFLRLEPSVPQIAAGQFTRDGKTIWLVGNMSKTNRYHGKATALVHRELLVLDPSTGKVSTARSDASGFELELAPMQSLILVLTK